MKIGPITIDRPVALAPMEDVTDTPFRCICKRLGADILFTEFTSSEALIRSVKSAFHKITLRDDERPIGIQIIGSREDVMAQAAKIAESAHPDFIDINCGCWVRKISMRGEGAGLLKDLKKMEGIIKAVVKATRLPVTVKTRLGWDADNIVIVDVAKMAQDQGVQALTVHCRTKTQAYKGKADWMWLEKIRKAVSLPLIGNGDIITPDDAKIIFDLGCDGVMVGRAAISNPWVFQQIKHFLKTGSHLPPASLQERINLCLDHLDLSIQFKGKKAGVFDFRKHYVGYLSGFPFVAKLRAILMGLSDADEIIRQLKEFSQDLPSKNS
ncbi:MAG: tRNA dihydrouridine synthase DusB [Candidatus Omnitrophota bacterium]